MKLLFTGTPAVAVPVAERLAELYDVSAVLTRPPAPQGRGARFVPSPVEQWARDRGLPVLAPARLRDPAVIGLVRDLAPDACPVVAYGGLLTTDLLEIPRYGWVNLHFSLLPEYRGAAPVQRALLDGRAHTGVTTFRIVEALDAGPVFCQRVTDVGTEETAGDLLARLAGLGAEVMAETLGLVEQGVAPGPQPTTGISLAPKVTPGEARLDLGAPAAAMVNRIRAMSPEPGAWAMVAGRRLRILRARVAPPSAGLAGVAPGALWATKRQLLCRTTDGGIELVEVQPEGKTAMAGAAWARGAWREGMSLD